MKKNSDLTLENIGKLIDERLTRNNVAIFGAIDGSAKRLEKKIDDLEDKMNQQFDMVGDQLQEVIQAASEITDQKLKEFKQKYLAA